jgi:hypothetical protein
LVQDVVEDVHVWSFRETPAWRSALVSVVGQVYLSGAGGGTLPRKIAAGTATSKRRLLAVAGGVADRPQTAFIVAGFLEFARIESCGIVSTRCCRAQQQSR